MNDRDGAQLLRTLAEGVKHACESLPIGEACAYLDYTLTRILPLLAEAGKEHNASRLPDFRAENVSEEPVHGWKHLVRRSHPWKKQLSVSGRKMTARQVAGHAPVNQLSVEESAANLGLPVEAVLECIDYVAQNDNLIRYENLVSWSIIDRYRDANPPLGGDGA